MLAEPFLDGSLTNYFHWLSLAYSVIQSTLDQRSAKRFERSYLTFSKRL